ncbi:hypothetical protein [Streptomyces rubradiris]|uniref:Uncharacterized protein n=1 Tax=Streptomyces rubradiris TaxID=285531 RepID=A0ABQ3RAB0_STRRR|nr:hypothetical protein [Streptomyces rubradiris]GHH25999.1 hypothetical protein GCM10018792_65880 [Streptomyces rubradiris]GHI52793.1 hypothetical protein Srubr_26390 [Streptomyces rubradiris]
MWGNLIAVVGTLAGVLLASLTQRWTERWTRNEQHRQIVADRVAALLDAVLAYRELFWLQVDSLRAGEGNPVERASFYRARSDVTRARDRLVLITSDPVVRATSEEAAWSALELSAIVLGSPQNGRFAPEVEQALDEGRERSRGAHTALRRAGEAFVSRSH